MAEYHPLQVQTHGIHSETGPVPVVGRSHDFQLVVDTVTFPGGGERARQQLIIMRIITEKMDHVHNITTQLH